LEKITIIENTILQNMFNFIRFVAYSIVAVGIRKGWNWITTDIDPMPGTKQFNIELLDTKAKYKRLKRKKEEYDETFRKIR
jgi:hypothetical protein